MIKKQEIFKREREVKGLKFLNPLTLDQGCPKSAHESRPPPSF